MCIPQIELRVLAHMSGDEKLIHLLRQAGEKGDAFTLIACAFLGKQSGVQLLILTTASDPRSSRSKIPWLDLVSI